MICIKNGRVHDAVHETPYIGNILIEEDKIISIGSDFSVPVDAHIIDAGGMEVYPGFVEAHCHLGLEEYGIGYEGMDINGCFLHIVMETRDWKHVEDIRKALSDAGFKIVS